jgi:hypothetical protein
MMTDGARAFATCESSAKSETFAQMSPLSSFLRKGGILVSNENIREETGINGLVRSLGLSRFEVQCAKGDAAAVCSGFGLENAAND